jgi:predicted KAP-like P-loop ATPase
MFRPDQPIKSKTEDILGRSSFAQAMGQAILDYKGKDSLVLGIFGEWGAGKSSIINMVLEYVDSVHEGKTNEDKPVIVKFDPWNYSNQNQLVTKFFRELSVALKRADYATGAKKLGEKLEVYARFFEPLVLIPTAGTAFGILATLFRSSGKAMRGWGEAKSKDLESIKSELNELLGKQSNKIIIVIDDMDRLTDIEIGQMFQLVKSLCDFHNTIYVLAFDKKVVVSALDRLQKGFGLQYLEKVVQVPFEIPLMPMHELQRFLLTQIDELIKEIPQEKWDQIRWGNIYYDGLRYFFNNIRDVTRYINSLRFGLSMVKNEINIIDFLAITAIQVFMPVVFYGIRDNKDIFSGVMESSYGSGEHIKEQTKARCDEIINMSTEFSKDMLKNFLKLLFPKLGAVYGNVYHGSESLGEWRKDGRICSPDIFDIFFRLSISKDEISKTELEAILSVAGNPDAFNEALLKLNKDGKIVRFLDRLEDYTHSYIPEENIENIITVLMDVGDLFPKEDSEFFGFDTPMRILRICHQLSRRLDSHEKRFIVFKNAIEKANRSLFTVVHEVSVQGQQHGKDGSKKQIPPEDQLTVNADQLKELERLACNKIEAWANDGRLSEHKELAYLLYRWREWGDPTKVYAYVNDIIKTDDGLVNFITSFLYKVKSQGVGSYVGRIHWQIGIKNILEFADLKQIEPRIRDILSSSGFDKLDEKKKLAIKTFIDTLDGKIKDPFNDT